MSKAIFKKDYWNVEIKGKLDNIINDLEKGVRDDDFNDNLLLVSNEIKKAACINCLKLSLLILIILLLKRLLLKLATAAINYVESIRKLLCKYL